MPIEAIVWGVIRHRQGYPDEYYPYGDVEAHQKHLEVHGAVYWDVGWKRCYTEQPVNGYLYIAPEAVKYKLKIERIFRGIISDQDEESKFIPPFRHYHLGKEETWIKITKIEPLKYPIKPETMIKLSNDKPIGNGNKSKAKSALQSAIRIKDESWE